MKMEENLDKSLSRSNCWGLQRFSQSVLCGGMYGFALDVIYGPCGPNAAQFMANGPKGFMMMFGGIGFMYGGLETVIYGLRGTSVDDVDVFNSSLAGFCTGALYKCKSGPKPAVIAAAFGGLVAGGFTRLMKKQIDL